MKMSLSFSLPINKWLVAFMTFFLIAGAETCWGAESEEVLAVYTNRAVPGLLFLAAVTWIVVAGYCLLKSPAGRDALRFFAGLAFLAGLLFGCMALSFTEKAKLTTTAMHFSYWEIDGNHDVRVPFEGIREVEIMPPTGGSHKYAPYLRYHHRWRVDNRFDRRLWFIDTRQKEDTIIGILAEHGVRVRDNRR